MFQVWLVSVRLKKTWQLDAERVNFLFRFDFSWPGKTWLSLVSGIASSGLWCLSSLLLAPTLGRGLWLPLRTDCWWRLSLLLMLPENHQEAFWRSLALYSHEKWLEQSGQYLTRASSFKLVLELGMELSLPGLIPHSSYLLSEQLKTVELPFTASESPRRGILGPVIPFSFTSFESP